MELLWLRRCLLAEAKDCEILNDITNLLHERGFSDIKPKYVGGLRVLLECPSPEVALKILVDGSAALSHWFTWTSPWSLDKELCHPGRLLWLSTAGVPLHA